MERNMNREANRDAIQCMTIMVDEAKVYSNAGRYEEAVYHMIDALEEIINYLNHVNERTNYA